MYRFVVGDRAFLDTPLGPYDYAADGRIDAYLEHLGTSTMSMILAMLGRIC